MHTADLDVVVRVKGRAIRERFDTQGRVFVEGRAGTQYDIVLRSNAFRELFVCISVDGRRLLYPTEPATQWDANGIPLPPLRTAVVSRSGVGDAAAPLTFGNCPRVGGVIGIVVYAPGSLNWQRQPPRDVLRIHYGRWRDLRRRNITGDPQAVADPFPGEHDAQAHDVTRSAGHSEPPGGAGRQRGRPSGEGEAAGEG